MLGSKWFSFVLFSLYFWFAAGCALGRADSDVTLDPSSLDFQLQAWVTFDDSASVRNDLTIAIKRLTQEKIGIPYPQHDLHVASIEPSVVQAVRQLPTKSGS